MKDEKEAVLDDVTLASAQVMFKELQALTEHARQLKVDDILAGMLLAEASTLFQEGGGCIRCFLDVCMLAARSTAAPMALTCNGPTASKNCKAN